MKARIATPPPLVINQAVVAVIDDLQQQLLNPQEKKAVHCIRVDIKRLRAWLRLIRYDAGEFDWRGQDKRLRDLAKRLSAKRDAQVILDTLRWLEKKTDKAEQRQAIVKVRSLLRFDTGRQRIEWAQIKTALNAEMEALRPQVALLDSIEIVRQGLKRTYKRARKRGRSAFSDTGGIEQLHKFRKWVKYLYYQLSFMEDVCPDSYNKTSRHLRELGNKLGRIHDLDIVSRRAEELSGGEECRDAIACVTQLVDARMQNLHSRCRSLYQDVFQVSASEFVGPLA